MKITLEGALQDAATAATELQTHLARDVWDDVPSAEEEDLISACNDLQAMILAFRQEAESRAASHYYERHGGENDEHRMTVSDFL